MIDAIERLNSGDASVRGELINLARARLAELAHELREEFQHLGDPPLDLTQIVEESSIRLFGSLHQARVRDARHFDQMAAYQIRRELADCFHRHGCLSLELENQRRMYKMIDQLPPMQRAVFELSWIHEMEHADIAQLLQMSEFEVKRSWRNARLALHGEL